MSGNRLVSFNKIGFSLVIASTLALAACDDNGEFAMPSLDRAAENETDTTSFQTPQSVELVERDVEDPDAFEVNEAGLWDGRPSLGGIWVAHPDVSEPERVIIRNPANGTSVIGALFRRERDNPGPALQVSSDAARALEMLAGSPTQLQVTALRREEVEETTTFTPPAGIAAAPIDVAPLDMSIDATPLDAPVDAEPLDVSIDPAPLSTAADVAIPDVPVTPVVDTIAAAAAAIEAAAAAAPPATTDASGAASSLTQPFIQIGTFTSEANANAAADQMRAAGVVPSLRQDGANWRVIVGPALSDSERSELLTQVQAQGFADAFFTAN